MRTLQSLSLLFVALIIVTGPASAQELPEGTGRLETEKLCRQCHELSRSISRRQDREGWKATLTKMSAYGMKATPKQLDVVLDYLSKNYPAEELPPVNVNTARAIELESGLTMRRSQAALLIRYREQHGPFKSIEDLKKVPGLDVAKLESKKDRITF